MFLWISILSDRDMLPFTSSLRASGSQHSTFVWFKRSTLWGGPIRKAVFMGQPRPRARKCFCAKEKRSCFLKAGPVSKKHDLVGGTLDLSTHLPLDWCSFTQHKCTASLVFWIFFSLAYPAVPTFTFLFLPWMLQAWSIQSYAFAVPFV